jgi:hypothetical protein
MLHGLFLILAGMAVYLLLAVMMHSVRMAARNYLWLRMPHTGYALAHYALLASTLAL